jgi:class 3 adenylate cyclase/tetratricopeptide (TPR) repeat protein
MKCAKCHFENPEGLTFCGKCGEKLEIVCSKCKFSNPPDFIYCGKCGNNLTLPAAAIPQEISFDEKLAKLQRYLPKDLAQKILAQKGKIEGERKQVTVMFCDMAGFTSLTEKVGSEQMYSIMDKVYEILIHQVHDYEGTVNELTGDGIMALFGAPIALEDGPQRAIRSALAIHQEINKFSTQANREKEMSPIKMRIGINTGQVIVGTLGNDLRVEFKAVGDTVNLASRMEGLAEPGTIYVTEETYRLARDLFHFEPLGKKKVKGKEEPVAVYKVLSLKKGVYRPRVGSERQIYSEMVGRESELNRLELQVMKAINGQGSIVNVIGEAGIGKSRLVAELKKREVVEKVLLLEGRAISMGRNLSYFPIIDCLKQWAQIRADDRDATALAKLEAAVVSLFPEGAGEVVPFVATLMGMTLWGRYAERVKGIEGEALEKLILKNVRDVSIRATERTPLVIITEDVQWADTSSIELLESLFLLAETHGILFVNVFRPGHKETGDRIAINVKQKLPGRYEEIVLKPLDERMSETLILNMLKVGGLHHAVIQQIIRRAGGNPFFIEEVVRSFIDEGVVVVKEGAFQVSEKIGTITIPNSINDVLMARIDRLEEKTRDLVKIASVIGRSFYHRILSEVASEFQDLEGRLSYLLDIQLIRERTRMGEVEYLFNHALVQEAAYESLLPTRRRDLHLKVAQSIEKIFRERLHEFYGMLAYHYSRAEDLDKAEEYLIKAGEEALRSAASDEALHHYEEALQLYLKKSGTDGDPEKVAMLEKNIALALYNRGQHQEAIKYFEKALDYYWGKLPKGRVTVAIKFMTAFLHFLIALYLPSLKFRKTPGEQDIEVVDLFFKKNKSLSMIDAKRFFIEYFYLFRFISVFDLQKFEDGIGIFVTASALLCYAGISFNLSRKVLDVIKGSVNKEDINNYTLYEICETVHHFLGGTWRAVKDPDDDLIEKICRVGKIYEASHHLYWHALSNICRGSFDKAKLAVRRLDDLFEVYGNDLSKSFKYLVNTMLLIESGKLYDAMVESERGFDFVRKGYTPFWQHPTLQASIHILRGDIEKAEKCLQYANSIRRQVKGTPFQLSNLYRTQSEFDLCRLKESIKGGNGAEVAESRRNAFKSGRLLQKVAQKVAFHRTDSYRLTGSYYWTINKRKRALLWWHRAVHEGERLGARPELARLYFEVGRCLLESKSKHMSLDGLEGEVYLEKARALFGEMEMESYLEEID